ncbi:lysine transporter LysE [Alsobacter metallidurans]|uniref:Lysine transporter LysE n=1 Tax=Alsobacter metallidurans TaxID=340221 RepID=A0A917I9X1_9HYPH|nr:LysE family transporter [Alsobacter metallidurans]GGH27362.1 lysine transporter LysE [Alsobacter metallidurans]
MSQALFWATVVAGFIYAVTPGPAFLAVFALAAQHGRGAGARFLFGHLAGDLLWGALALAAIVGVNQIGPALFDALGVGCGLYLIYLGCKAAFSRGGGEPAIIGSLRPIRAGLLFGVTNPKSYPVSLAVFTALTVRYAAEIDWSAAPALMGAAVIGFFLGYIVVLFWAGLPLVRRFFLRHGRVVTRVVGVMFILFGAKSLVDAGRSVASRA